MTVVDVSGLVAIGMARTGACASAGYNKQKNYCKICCKFNANL